MEALMRAVLGRHRDLGIHPITFKVQRFPGRDSGMVKEGPEIARVMVKKTEYSRLILVWDHHGSGWHNRSAEDVLTRIQQRLDGVTWADRSAAVVIVPELEEWLWHCTGSIARLLGVNAVELDEMTGRAADQIERPRERCCRELPKEAVLCQKKRRKPLPEDFKVLGSFVNLSNWTGSDTFARFTEILKAWFPSRARS
jgi:hypothetical protein